MKKKHRLRTTWTAFFAFFLAAMLLLLVACAPQVPEAAPTPAAQVYEAPATQIMEGSFISTEGREEWDYFGGSLASDGDLLVTGAPRWNSPEVAAGKAYVLRRSAEGEWQSEAILTASDRDDGFQFDQHFGSAVGVNSAEGPLPPVVAVGAPGTDDPQAGDNTGAVYIYEYDGRNWAETAKLTPSRTPNAKIGQELSLSGDILVVSGAPEAGEVYSFRREAGGWHELAPLTVPASPDGGPASVLLDLYGDTLALSTFTVKPLNPANYSEQPRRTGIVTLLERSGDRWKQVFQTPPQEAFAPAIGYVAWEQHPFGIQVSLGGAQGQASWLAIGKPGSVELDAAHGGKPGLAPVPGCVVLYARGDNGWSARAELRLSPGELVPGAFTHYSADPATAFFGSYVDIEGNRLAVLAAFANTVNIFERQGQDWIYRFRVSPGGSDWRQADDYHRRIVVMEGNNLFLGSPTELGDGGIFHFELAP